MGLVRDIPRKHSEKTLRKHLLLVLVSVLVLVVVVVLSLLFKPLPRNPAAGTPILPLKGLKAFVFDS